VINAIKQVIPVNMQEQQKTTVLLAMKLNITRNMIPVLRIVRFATIFSIGAIRMKA
jgi:hypothetical protein